MVGYPQQCREVGRVTREGPGKSHKRKPLESHRKYVESRRGEISKIMRITKIIVVREKTTGEHSVMSGTLAGKETFRDKLRIGSLWCQIAT